MKVLQKGFNYSQDGPGNRLVYHLQGCNFRCKWCSNADSIPVINSKSKEMSIDDIYDEIIRSKMMFFDGGGVTFTGGEATLQHKELLTLLIKLKESDINTCIETNGSLVELREISNYIDHLIIDLKHFDDEKHMLYCGCSNKITKENIEYFFSIGRPIHIRIPLINNINTDPIGFAEYFSRFNTENSDFEFLPYHEFGKEKWTDEYEISDGFVSSDKINEFNLEFNKRGLKVIKT